LRDTEGVEVAATLWASGRPIGLLALGKRWDEEIFDERDLEIVELIAQQAALFLLTAAQIDELRQVPHQIAETQERERFKIAQELHDTVQQFLGRLPFYLEVSRSAAREDPAEAESILERCMTDVEAAAQTVREIRANLAPLQLERSLVIPLRRLVAHFTARSGVAHEVVLGASVDTGLGLEARHAVYRVVQQALDNVAAHAEASHVTVTVDREEERVLFAVRDDGRGFADEQRNAAAERGSFGLTSMHARITSLGGELTIESVPGAGTYLRGWLPRDSAA
jgi:signal transduction histidine kinase